MRSVGTSSVNRRLGPGTASAHHKFSAVLRGLELGPDHNSQQHDGLNSKGPAKPPPFGWRTARKTFHRQAPSSNFVGLHGQTEGSIIPAPSSICDEQTSDAKANLFEVTQSRQVVCSSHDRGIALIVSRDPDRERRDSETPLSRPSPWAHHARLCKDGADCAS